MNEADIPNPEPQTEPHESLPDTSPEERARDAAEHAEQAARAEDEDETDR